MKGSATVLKTMAAAAPSSLTESSTGLPSTSRPISPAFSSAEGASQHRPSINCSMPRISRASPQNTGVMVPDFTPLLTPTMTSSGVKGSPAKYFSKSASSVSATAS